MVANNRFGFTLLELLVALAAASLIILAVTTTLFSLQKGYDATSQGMEQRRAVRSSLDLLRREIASVLYQQSDEKLLFQVKDRDYYGKPASSLSYATLAPPIEGDVSDQLRVEYLPEEAGNSIRLARASRDLFLADATPIKAYPIVDNLEGFLVECYDGSKWVKSWDTVLNQALPKQVRITLTLRDGDTKAEFQVLATPRINAR